MKSIVGKILCDRYRVLEELNRDDFRGVYLAEDLGQIGKQKCQIERFHPQYDSEILGSQSWQKVYLAFIEAGNNFKHITQHPQIPQLLAHFECDRDFYLVNEFIVGRSLDDKLSHSLLTETEAIAWLQEMLEVLAFVHQAGVIHLNIQPTSLIDSEGIKFLTDFAGVRNTILFNGKCFNNLVNQDFTSPEQLLGKPDFSTDIYALGKTLIYALTGQIFDFVHAKATEKSLDLIVSKDSKIATVDLQPRLVDILNKMVSPQLSQRYQSAKEVLASLDFEDHNVVVFPPAFLNNSSAIPTTYPLFNKSKNRNRNNSKLFKRWIGLLLAIPFIIALFILFLGINNRGYRDFASYVNEDYQFQLKYPQNWSYQELSDPITGGVVVFTSPLETDADLFLENVYITVEDLSSKSTTLEEYTKIIFARIQQEKGNEIEVYQDRKTKIAKFPARRIIYSRQEEGILLRQMETFTIRNNQVYIAIYTAERAKFSKFLDTAEKIVNSWEIQ
ncbi:serine/threonine protein kinase [Chondrocystis sp. NIES-4102]|nr:serine/threonine protein kinase [Chondrocystis sp. NIES-4102]